MRLYDRMKTYEKIYDYTITSRLPIIVRIDGKNFSGWTKKNGFQKPFDEHLAQSMAKTMHYVANNVEGCVFGLTQSDEISLLIRNDQSLESEPVWGNRVQKICSIISSLTTAKFNQCIWERDKTLALFDARAFAVPGIKEARNYFICRQNDCVRNSITTACYYEVGNKVGRKTARNLMHGKNGNEQQEILFSNTGINWNDYPVYLKRGVAVYKEPVKITEEVVRNKWKEDYSIPIFTAEPDFLEKKIYEI